MTQFDLTDDPLQIQEMARKFTADAITPFAAEWDEKHILPRDTIREAAELGFGASHASEEGGGDRLGRNRRLGRERRHRPRAARSRADLRGLVLRLPIDERLHLDPQHG